MKKHIIYILFFLLTIVPTTLLGQSAYNPSHGGGSSLPTTCTDGQVVTWNNTTKTWSTCANLAGGGDLTHSGTPANHYWGVFASGTTIKGVAVTASGVACIDSNGEPVKCTNLTDAAFSSYLPLAGGTLSGAIIPASGMATIGTSAAPFVMYASYLDLMNGVTTYAIYPGTPGTGTTAYLPNSAGTSYLQTLSANVTVAGKVPLSTTTSGLDTYSPFTIPTSVCTLNYGLISDGTNFICTSSAFGTGAYATIANYLALGGGTMTGKLITVASAAVAGAGVNLPSGVVPNSPGAGDLYYDGTHLYFYSGSAHDLLAGGGAGTGDLVAGATTNTNLAIPLFSSTAKTLSGSAIQPGTAGYYLRAYGSTTAPAFASPNLDTWAAIAPTASIQTLISSTTLANLRTNAGLSIGADVEAYNAILASIAALTAASNAVIGWNNGPTLGAYTTHQHTDSAAQFVNSADATKLILMNAVSVSTGGQFTFKPQTNAASEVKLKTPIMTGDDVVATIGASQTFTGNNVFNGANTGTGSLKMTGNVSGGLPPTTIATSVSYRVGSADASESYGQVFYCHSNPCNVGLAYNAVTGMNIGVYADTQTRITLSPAASDYLVNVGSLYTLGSSIVNSTSAMGNFAVVHYQSTSYWRVWGYGGTWIGQ